MCYHPIVLPASKAQVYLTEVQNVLQPITEFRLRQIERDVSASLSKVSPDEAGQLWCVLGWVHYRRGGSEREEAYQCFLRAHRLRPQSGDGHRAAAVLVELGRPAEALELLEQPDPDERMMPHNRITSLGNQAHAHMLLGNPDRAHELLTEAIQTTDYQDVDSVCRLAIACADSGYREEAVEFLARTISILRDEVIPGRARDYVATHEALVNPTISIHPGLRRAVLDERTFGESFADSLPWVPASTGCAEEEDMAPAMYEETASSRRRANAAVLDVEEG
jgi:tetratricopeptide (TPR) repeat protein